MNDPSIPPPPAPPGPPGRFGPPGPPFGKAGGEPPAAPKREMHFMDYVRVLDKRRRMVLLFFALTVGSVLFFTFSQPKIFRAEGFLLIDEEFNRTWEPNTGRQLNIFEMERAYKTIQEVARSYDLVEEVVNRLRQKYDASTVPTARLYKPTPNLWFRIKSRVATWLGIDAPKAPWSEGVIVDRDLVDPVVYLMQKSIDIDEVEGTALLRVRVENVNPHVAQDACNLLMELFIEKTYARRVDNVTRAITYFTKQLDEVRLKMGAAEVKAFEYLDQEQIANPLGSEKNFVRDQLTRLNTRMQELKTSRKELEAKYAELSKIIGAENPFSHTAFLDGLNGSDYFKKLDEQMAESNLALVSLLQRYKDQHPDVVAVRNRLEALKAQYLQAVNNLVASTASELSVANEQVEYVQETIAKFERESIETAKKSVEYQLLHDDSEIATTIYENLLTKLSDLDLSAEIQTTPIVLIHRAKLPVRPAKPLVMLNVVTGLIIGILGGIGLAFAQEYMDRSIRTPEDAEEYLGLPVLALVPTLDGEGQSKMYYY